MTRVVISQPMYFPWAGFLAQMALADVMIWLDDAQFSKGSFTNRVQVKLPGGRKWMSLPLESKGSHMAIADLRAVGQGWRDSHRSVIQASLGTQPCFADAQSCMDAVFQSDATLCDMIIASGEALARQVGIAPAQTLRSSQMDVAGQGWQRVLDMVRAVDGTEYITGHGARNYLDHAAFEAAGITVSYMDYAPLPWPQAHGDFTPYVTGLDLIAAVAPADRATHLNPRTLPWRQFVTTAD
jgi:hypothetical protein